MRARLCSGCYGKGHCVKDCRSKRTCHTCKKNHPTGLHEYKSSKREETRKEEHKPNAVCDEEGIRMCVVPVLLRHTKAISDILTYALLDPCSQGTFVDNEMLLSLSVDITVKTLNGSSCEQTILIQDFSVQSLNLSQSNQWYQLPTVYSRPYLPIEKEEIPTPEKLKHWAHLSSIVNEIRTITSGKVGLLIGSNCPKLLEHIQVIPSCDNVWN